MEWSPQQDDALVTVSKWIDDPSAKQVFRLFGWAGTGKSTLARYLAEDVKQVCYAAFTGKAALVMRKNGCHGAKTIHSLIYSLVEEKGGEPTFRLNRDSEVADADLVVIDEVSMVGEELARDLLSFGKKILVLGDPFQLPPVKSEGYFTNVTPDIMLTEIHRQAADNPIIRMSMDIREGHGLVVGADYGQSKVINASDVDRDEVMKADQILCGRNLTRITYNDRVRNLKGLPARTPVVGDRLICLRNNKEKNLLNGQLWTATEVKKKNNIFHMLLDPEDAGLRVANAKVHTHEKFFQGREEEFDWRERRKFDEFYFGYCLTVHKSQGSQWNSVYLFDESGVFRESAANHLYTAVTRAAEQITVVM